MCTYELTCKFVNNEVLVSVASIREENQQLKKACRSSVPCIILSLTQGCVAPTLGSNPTVAKATSSLD
jgi:hypothetical protein